MKKEKRYVVLLTIFTIIFTVALSYSTIFLNNANAEPNDDDKNDISVTGDNQSARMKLWYSMLSSCTNQPSAWGNSSNTWESIFAGLSRTAGIDYLTAPTDYLTPLQVRQGEWFKDYSLKVTDLSAYIEFQVEGAYGDGKFTCGTKDNALAKKAIEELNLNPKDVACDYRNPTQDALLTAKSSDCAGAYDASNGNYIFSFNDKMNGGRASSYLDSLVSNSFTDKYGGVPGGSLGALTPLERYFVLYDAFSVACANTNSLHFASQGDNPSNFDYQIWARNPDGKAELAGVAYLGSNDTGNKKIPIYNKEIMTCNAIADELKDEKKASTEAYIDFVNNGGTNDPITTSAIDKCYTSGGAGNMGYIICEILDMVGQATTSLYDSAIKPALNIEPKLFEGGGNTQQAWSVFQGIANVIFIIFFLFVIFSQVTGVGIDNYGIKKILPKLIISAILINLSYYICVICVDLSNILGNGIQDIFNSLSFNPTITVETLDGSVGINAGTEISVGLLSALAIGGAVAMIWANPAMVLGLLVGAIGVAISIFFLFILLSAREAAIVVLTVISPIAFACYMLPNTKNLFSKFVKFGEGLLLLYPICGLLIGGGNFVSRLLLSSGVAAEGFWSALTAMLIGIIPIFFIPTVLKGSFAALGNLGAKISGFGDRMRGGATRGVRGSEAYRNAQKLSQERATRIRAGYDSSGNKRRLNAFQTFVRGGRRNVQRNALAYQKIRSERGALDATEGDEFMLETETANEAKNIVATGEINSLDKLENGLDRAIKTEDHAKIRAYTDALAGKGKNGRALIKKVYNNNAKTMTSEAAMTFANNIIGKNGASFKEKDRSMYEVASRINKGDAAITTQDYLDKHNGREELATKLSAETLGDMDNAAIKEMFGNVDGNETTFQMPISDPDKMKQIGAAAYRALSSGTVKDINRQALLQRIISKSGYTPEIRTVRIDRNPQNPNGS